MTGVTTDATSGTTTGTTVQSPLTLVMPVRPDARAALRAEVEQLQALPRDRNPVITALDAIGTVHFARFVFLDDDARLAVITTYDGDFERYIMDFVDHIGPVFDMLLRHMVDPPPLPVQQHPEEFLAYVRRHDLGCVGPFYSAYPTRPVIDIRADDAG
ncbi:hypothetical protein [Geodermatophilus obscurus]|jgi:hypothetical protein|uniref:Uncharacterized protein n=1 Tax=Geodermatophilus obscurus (strain ATCC 25078 / DSM 43160 / JCM 3152 / CCUG 61914 / KCC A-0152 / KCTC 9177 / NBRC 13315 / NRRL B-3577 / G-20) TaxID=526225 RepID=D2S491_GEOOG|nr:hypothetical protein [Geodermatophilus obscurus]ADB75081.1 conserved hypothetical protein [Geodermatophilus obscurus DSM 43160]